MSIQAAVYVVQTLNRETGVWEDRYEVYRMLIALGKAQTLEHSGYRTRIVSRTLATTHDSDPIPFRSHIGRSRHGR